MLHRITILALAALVGAASMLTPSAAWADCAPMRPASAAEKKIHADGFALFQRIAPAAPEGWQARDSPASAALGEVCAGPETVTKYGFQRSYDRTEGMEARQAEAQRAIGAVAQNAEARRQANEARLADVQKRMEAVQKKMQGLIAANKIAELEALNPEIEKLMQEQMKLMDVDGQTAATDAIDAEMKRDTSAIFSLVVGEHDLNTGGFSPVTVGGIKAFRQLIEAEGGRPASADFIIVVTPATTPRGPQTVVHISGDPARAEALVKAARFR